MIKKIRYKNHEDFLAKRSVLKGASQPNVFRLGASDVGVVLGLNEYVSSRVFFYQSCEFVERGFTETLDTHRGRLQESTAWREYWRWIDPTNPASYLDNYYRGNAPLRNARKSNTIYLNSKYDFIFASPDYEILKSDPIRKRRGNLEVKVPQKFVMDKYEAGIAEEYVAQTQAQMYVAGFPYSELIALLDAKEPRCFYWEEGKEHKQFILDTCHDYVQDVLKGKAVVYSDMSKEEKEQALMELAPEETNELRYAEYLKDAHKPENAKVEVDGTTDQLDVVLNYLQLKETEKETLKYENKIREFFTGNIGKISFGKDIGSISYKQKLYVPSKILRNYHG